MQIEKCGGCKYWEWDNETSEIKYGTCHRFPKTSDDYGLTKENYWCGEFKTRSQLHS